jgi:hypothetical protein
MEEEVSKLTIKALSVDHMHNISNEIKITTLHINFNLSNVNQQTISNVQKKKKN